MTKYKIPGLILVTVIGLGIAGVGVNALHAATPSGAFNPMSNLVNAIAEKFNLNPTEVQSVFDTERIKMEAQREELYKAKISDLVSTGKLSQTQADLLISKHQEIENNKIKFKDLSKEEIQNQIQIQRDELKSWAEQNNIPIEYLHFGPGGYMKGMGQMMGDRMRDNNDSDD